MKDKYYSMYELRKDAKTENKEFNGLFAIKIKKIGRREAFKQTALRVLRFPQELVLPILNMILMSFKSCFAWVIAVTLGLIQAFRGYGIMIELIEEGESDA